MKTIWTIFKKDLRLAWPALAVWTALQVALFGYYEWYWLRVSENVGRTGAETIIPVMLIFADGALWVMTFAGIFQSDSTLSDRTWWRTRPIRGRVLMCAKMMFIGVWLLVWPQVWSACFAFYAGALTREVVSVAIQVWAARLLLGLGLGVVAVLTRTRGQFVLALLSLLLAIFLIGLSADKTGILSANLNEAGSIMACGVYAIGLGGVLVRHFWILRVKSTFISACAVLAMSLTVLFCWPSEWGLSLSERKWSRGSEAGIKLKLSGVSDSASTKVVKTIFTQRGSTRAYGGLLFKTEVTGLKPDVWLRPMHAKASWGMEAPAYELGAYAVAGGQSLSTILLSYLGKDERPTVETIKFGTLRPIAPIDIDALKLNSERTLLERLTVRSSAWSPEVIAALPIKESVVADGLRVMDVKLSARKQIVSLCSVSVRLRRSGDLKLWIPQSGPVMSEIMLMLWNERTKEYASGPSYSTATFTTAGIRYEQHDAVFEKKSTIGSNKESALTDEWLHEAKLIVGTEKHLGWFENEVDLADWKAGKTGQ